ncbi:class I SAM-dependent methyltransferase [Bacillus carboniphilus]|uniref:Class I SAM-dependent methyltransferase n=1 Tax=Bacillus carboniphilus TaxID=86663 RepID=A0ABY9JSF8_9BACI|nr:class I SAM-dependent methyltransferase [Bacillus carboniphilus]WLR42340.1 class I SAM-dependent methyltransferase [Bacillus carboniphilus]
MMYDMLRDPKEFWEDFYEDRSKEIPFFQIEGPDENLVHYFEQTIAPKKVLELGWGPGRNAIYMAKQGCKVDAIDISENAIEWANERALKEGVSVNFHCRSIFDIDVEPATYDFIYDCGLFHHLAPHRRLSHIEMIKKALKKDGFFGIVCFNKTGASDTSDWDIYKKGSLNGGIGYSEERLKDILNKDFIIHEFRTMRKIHQPNSIFGEDFLWTSLMTMRDDA